MSACGGTAREPRRCMVLAIAKVSCFLTASFMVLALSTDAMAARLCGDQSNNGTVTAGDALGVLKASVGSLTCDVCVCDANHSGTITAGDALLVLKFAVGQPVGLNCSSCQCNDSPAPQCGGDCDGSRICAVSPWDPTHTSCECVTPCQIAAAPACGASCEGSDRPEDVCTHVEFTYGDVVEDRCECLPPGTKACQDTSSPACGGACGGGHQCVSQSGKCKCIKLAEQGPCAQAEAPACGGTCGENQICQVSGDSCVCGQSTGEDPCYDVTAPMCGAPCNDGRLCATEVISGCGCFEPCGVKDAPACNGSCFDPQATCTVTTAKIGNSSIQFCECR